MFMKSTGIVRQVDELGRSVIPIELRRTININQKVPLEVYIEGNAFVNEKQNTNNDQKEEKHR